MVIDEVFEGRNPSYLIKGNLTYTSQNLFREIIVDGNINERWQRKSTEHNYRFIELVFIRNRNLWENAVSKEIAYEEDEPTTRLKIRLSQFMNVKIYWREYYTFVQKSYRVCSVLKRTPEAITCLVAIMTLCGKNTIDK